MYGSCGRLGKKLIQFFLTLGERKRLIYKKKEKKPSSRNKIDREGNARTLEKESTLEKRERES